ncbi:MAG TPA: SDR family oxidoreductase [Candidatus Krumholzibacteria bacterium]|nr:SDR family oxidoreductase [Candidatus Krumholzibacteria bacterium]
MAIFLSGATGYIGAHVAANLLAQGQSLNLLVRARDAAEADRRLWQALQLHLDFPTFHQHLRQRIQMFRGDLTLGDLGLESGEYERLVQSTDSIIHCAASLNRRSEKSCLNVNLRGTLEALQLARRIHASNGLRRFSHVSTVAVAGHRQDEVVTEDQSIDWARSDYDPYARTKKFCEHMLHELLPPDTSHLVFRPSIVLGDSRRGETTQFDMVRAFVFLAGLPVLPFNPLHRVDIVPVEFVADSISTLHLKDKPAHGIYHLSSGTGAQTFRQLTDALADARGGRRPLYAPFVRRPFDAVVAALASQRGTRAGHVGSLLKVFLPYLYWNTVFDNQRIVTERGCEPRRFSEYSLGLLRFATAVHFQYPAQEWPADPASAPARATVDSTRRDDTPARRHAASPAPTAGERP